MHKSFKLDSPSVQNFSFFRSMYAFQTFCPIGCLLCEEHQFKNFTYANMVLFIGGYVLFSGERTLTKVCY